MVEKCFDKKSKGSGAAMLADTPNHQIADELCKSFIGKLNIKHIHLSWIKLGYRSL